MIFIFAKGENVMEKRFSMNLEWAIRDLEKDLNAYERIKEQLILSSKDSDNFAEKLIKIDNIIESTKKRISEFTTKLPENKEGN